MEDDPKTFLAQLERLERAYTAEVRPAVAAGEEKKGEGIPVVGPVDEGTMKAEELIERLLKEWEAGP